MEEITQETLVYMKE